MKRYLAIDFEGTNKDPRRGCPAQLGIALMEGTEVIESDEFLISVPKHYKSGKPMREVDAYSLQIWGMTLERLEAEGLTSREACRRLLQFSGKVGGAQLPIVAFNISYDLECYRSMLFDGGEFNREYYEYFAFPENLSGAWHCAFSRSRSLLSDKLLKFDLDSVAGHYGLSRSTGLHGALEDAILAGPVYTRLSYESAKRVPA